MRDAGEAEGPAARSQLATSSSIAILRAHASLTRNRNHTSTHHTTNRNRIPRNCMWKCFAQDTAGSPQPISRGRQGQTCHLGSWAVFVLGFPFLGQKYPTFEKQAIILDVACPPPPPARKKKDKKPNSAQATASGASAPHCRRAAHIRLAAAWASRSSEDGQEAAKFCKRPSSSIRSVDVQPACTLATHKARSEDICYKSRGTNIWR